MKVPKWVDKALLVVGLGLLVYVITRFPLDETLDRCAKMWPRVALTPVIAVSWFCCSSSALWILLDGKVPWRRILWIRLVGDSYNSLLPLGGFGGEPFKIRQLSQHVDTATVMTALIRDRVIDNAMGFAVSATGVALGLAKFALDDAVRVPLVVYAAIAGALAVMLFVLVLTRFTGKLGGWLAKLVDAAPEKIETLPAGRLVKIASWAVLARALGLLEIATLLWILDLPHGVMTVAFVDSFLNAAGYIGFFIPQGLGVFEASSAWLFKNVLGAPGASALAFAFARRGRMLAVGLFGVGLHVASIARQAVAARRRS